MIVMVDTKKWITSKEAADILTLKNGRPISDAYVRRLASLGKIATHAIDERTKLYLRSDVEKYSIKPRGTGEVRKAQRKKRPIIDEPDKLSA
jgi:hypothetical protein